MKNIKHLICLLFFCLPTYTAFACEEVVPLSGGAHALVTLYGGVCNVIPYMGASNWDPTAKRSGTLSACTMISSTPYCYYHHLGGYVQGHVAHSHQCGGLYFHYTDRFYLWFPHCCIDPLCDEW